MIIVAKVVAIYMVRELLNLNLILVFLVTFIFCYDLVHFVKCSLLRVNIK